MRRALLPLLLLVALAVALPAGAAAAKGAAVCAKPAKLTFDRKAGKTVGMLRWRGARGTKRFRVLRNGRVVGQTRRRAMRIAVRLDRTYKLSVVTLTSAGKPTRCRVTRRVRVAYRVPGAPQGLAISGDERGLTLDWFPGRRGDGRFAGYRLLRDGAPVGQTKARSWSLGAVPNRSYRFAVVAVDTRGRASAASNAVTITTGHVPPAPPQGVEAMSVSESSIGAQWQASTVGNGRIVGYRVLRDGVVVRQVRTTSTVLDNLAASSDYRISIVAVDGLGYQSAPSAEAIARTQDPVPTSGHAHAYLLATTDQSFADFRAHYRQIGYVYPTYYDCNGNLDLLGHDDPLVSQWAQARRVMLMPRVNCQGTTKVHRLLTEQPLRDHWLDMIESLAVDNGYDGISLDLEAGAGSDRAAMSSFVSELAARLHSHGKLLTLAVSPKTWDNPTHPRGGIFDYPHLSQDADWLVVMTWGVHWSTSAPGAQDELPWARSVADYVATLPLHRKFIYGTNLYAMDWPAGGGPGHPAETEQYGELVPRLPGLGATIGLDTRVDGMHATYTDGNGVDHDVWYPDAGTTGRRMQMAHDDGFGGVGFWRLGMEDQRVWDDPLIAAGVAW